MSENKPRDLIPSQGGFLQDLSMRVKLILRLMGDSRVNPILKVIPVGVVAYLLLPDIAPGPIDDAAVAWLGLYMFVELCPPNVVDEHMKQLRPNVPPDWSKPPSGKSGGGDDDVVDADFREM